MKSILHAALAAGLLAAPALAQSPSGSWNGLPEDFQLDTGFFRISPNTVLRYNARPGSGDVDFEKDLGLPDSANTFWVDATWRAGRRHQLKLSYTKLNRERDNFQLQRDFAWGGQTYSAGLSAATTSGSDLLGGYYRFALFRNDRFEIGPSLGVGYLWLDAGIRATGTLGTPGGSQSRTLDESASTGSVTGAVGGYADAWLTRRLVVRGDYLYIKVKPENAEASVTDWRLAADYYVFRNAGLGVQYKYNRYTYDRGILSGELGGEMTFEGIQVFLSFLF